MLTEIWNTPLGSLSSCRSITVSPDGAHVYATGGPGVRDAVTVLSREATTGLLTAVETHRDGVGGVDGLNFPLSLVVSPDGLNVYVTSRDDNAIAVFGRDSATGRLTFLEALRNGVDGIEGFDPPYSLAVSPDGRHVYVAGYQEHAVVVFARDLVTGHLSPVEIQRDRPELNGVLRWPSFVLLTSNGLGLYALGGSGIGLFGRNAATGTLTFKGRDTYQMTSLGQPMGAAALSGDDRHLYVPIMAADANEPDIAAVGLYVACGDGIVTPEEGCDDANLVDGDGCSSGCAVESGYVCSGEPSVCTTPTATPTRTPVPAGLVLHSVRLKAHTIVRPENGTIRILAYANVNAPYDRLVDDIIGSGLAVHVRGAGGVEETLNWASADCNSKMSRRGPIVRCKFKDGRYVLRSAYLRPALVVPDVLRIDISARRRSFPPPLTTDAVTVRLSSTSCDREDRIGDAGTCTVRGRRSEMAHCFEFGTTR
jgi:cysteine-rich repeat protein